MLNFKTFQLALIKYNLWHYGFKSNELFCKQIGIANKYIDYEEELCEIKSIEDIEEDTEINQFDNIEEDTKNLEKDFEVSYENINDNN